MRRLLALLLALAGTAAAAPSAAAVCAVDDVPAATLLVPYFEVDLASATQSTTLVTVRNSDAQPALAQVTLWSDWGVPTLLFHVYLTGYDVQSFNLRDVFEGRLPRTADHGADPTDTSSPTTGISNQGPLSGDVDYPGSIGPCASPYPAPPQPALDAATIDQLRRAHTGMPLPGSGLCAGQPYGDALARGYLTIDVVDSCSLVAPDEPGYFAGIASRRNVLTGRVLYVDPQGDSAQGESVVHIEACPATGGTAPCPFQAGQLTFYGAYLNGSAADQREPLPSTFSLDYFMGGAFDGGTELLVWRDRKGAGGLSACNTLMGGSFLPDTDVVAFDEQENPSDLCFPSDNVCTPIGSPTPCFPLAAQRINLEGGNLVSSDPTPPFSFGWMFLNLRHGLGGPVSGYAQAWVLARSDGEGRYSTLHRGTALDSGCTATPGQGQVLIP
jgi:hypothetical protein